MNAAADTASPNYWVYVVSLSGVTPDGERTTYDEVPFETLDAARGHAEDQVRESTEEGGTACEFHANVACVGRDDFAVDFWALDDGNTVGRATWDTATGAVIWQHDGPFDWDSYPQPTQRHGL
ncbi:hypothetical protein [Nocardia thraciensis]